MAITVEKFGELDGKEVNVYTLTNKSDLSVEIINLGGIIKRLVYKGVDVVTGRDSLEEYKNNSGCFGALIGRNSNRIENSEFELNGKKYTLYANNGRNNLHGGKIGFDKKVWDAKAIDGDEPKLVLTYVSPDGEEGFPGNADIKVTYTLTKDSGIEIHYEGTCDEDTVLNMTNHSYFNLNGHASGNIDGHSMWIDADFYTPNTDECMPYGEILSVKGTPFDFSTDALMGERFKADYEQIKMFNGFDHNLVLNGKGFRKIAEAKGDKTGITMQVYTDLPGVQLYTSNGADSDRVCKDGATYCHHSAFCLETQMFPNNLKYSHFPSAILKKGDKYDTKTTYKFI